MRGGRYKHQRRTVASIHIPIVPIQNNVMGYSSQYNALSLDCAKRKVWRVITLDTHFRAL